MSSSILNLFLQGDGMSGACSGSIKSWPSIAVPLGLAHFPNKLLCPYKSILSQKSYMDIPKYVPCKIVSQTEAPQLN